MKIINGGKMLNDKTYFCEPTLVESNNINSFIFNKEFFAPILGVYFYDDSSETTIYNSVEMCCNNNKYGLTGSIFSNNSKFINYTTEMFKDKWKLLYK